MTYIHIAIRWNVLSCNQQGIKPRRQGVIYGAHLQKILISQETSTTSSWEPNQVHIWASCEIKAKEADQIIMYLATRRSIGMPRKQQLNVFILELKAMNVLRQQRL